VKHTPIPSESMAIGNFPIKARDGRGRAIRSLETVKQDQRAAELRSESLTYAEIAEQLGISVTAAHESAVRGMAAVPTENQIAAKCLELLKLDRRERRLFAIMDAEHLKIDRGQVVCHDGRPVVDPAPVIAASNALDRIAVRRARLLGLDAPQRFRVGTLSEEDLDEEIARLERELGAIPAESWSTEDE